MRPRESAISLPVPEAQALVGPWRARFDPSAAVGVPAHISLLYPFLPPAGIEPADEERLAAVFASTPATPYTLTAVRRFSGVLYLAPEPESFFRELMRRVWALFPDTPPYGGRFQDVVPHLTVAQTEDASLLDAAEAAVSGGLPLRAHAGEAWLQVEGDDGWWRIHRRFPLGGG